MPHKYQKLEINQKELAVIEAALHTQAKILNVQAGAGGSTARERLNEVKRVIALIEQNRIPDPKPARRSTSLWLGLSRIFG